MCVCVCVQYWPNTAKQSPNYIHVKFISSTISGIKAEKLRKEMVFNSPEWCCSWTLCDCWHDRNGIKQLMATNCRSRQRAYERLSQAMLSLSEMNNCLKRRVESKKLEHGNERISHPLMLSAWGRVMLQCHARIQTMGPWSGILISSHHVPYTKQEPTRSRTKRPRAQIRGSYLEPLIYGFKTSGFQDRTGSGMLALKIWRPSTATRGSQAQPFSASALGCREVALRRGIKCPRPPST